MEKNLIAITQVIHSDSSFLENSGQVITSQSIISRSKRFATYLRQKSYNEVIIGDLSPSHFAIAFYGALLSGVEINIPHNYKKQTINEIETANTLYIENLLFLDQIKNESLSDSLHRNSIINLYTSGSQSHPKRIEKTFDNLFVEASTMRELFQSQIRGQTVYATVTHQHIYGLLFKILIPNLCGLAVCEDLISYPEQLTSKEAIRLITSPAFLKRIGKKNISNLDIKAVISSGGRLDLVDALNCSTIFNCVPLEIYGSTETGGIAWRKQQENSRWQVLPGINLTQKENNLTAITSPFFSEDEKILDDLLEFDSQGTFRLSGRQDRTVKIEEKRVNLSEIEYSLQNDINIKVCYCTMREDAHRQSIALLIVLEENSKLNFVSKLQRNQYIQSLFLKKYEAILSPKKIRYRQEIPRNTQSKLDHEAISELFNWPDERLEIHSFDALQIKATLSYPANHQAFDGHFENFKILPALIQIKNVIDLSKQYFKILFNHYHLQNLKFITPIFPEQSIHLTIILDTHTQIIDFSYKSDQKVLSKGKIKL